MSNGLSHEERDEIQRRIDSAKVERRPIRLSPWTPVHGYEYCAMRFVEGTDPNDIANRFAFIEKTPRIRIHPMEHDPENDFRNWQYGPKGRGCSYDQDAERERAYGFYPPSREWCDRELLRLGYVLPDRTMCKGFGCTNLAELEPSGNEFGFCELCQVHDEV